MHTQPEFIQNRGKQPDYYQAIDNQYTNTRPKSRGYHSYLSSLPIHIYERPDLHLSHVRANVEVNIARTSLQRLHSCAWNDDPQPLRWVAEETRNNVRPESYSVFRVRVSFLADTRSAYTHSNFKQLRNFDRRSQADSSQFRLKKKSLKMDMIQGDGIHDSAGYIFFVRPSYTEKRDRQIPTASTLTPITPHASRNRARKTFTSLGQRTFDVATVCGSNTTLPQENQSPN